MNLSNTNHKNALIAAVIIILALLASLIVYQMTRKGRGPEGEVVTKPLDVTERKQEIVALVREKETLSENDKREIIGDISGSNFSKYNFSEEEKIKLIKALNK